MNKLGGLNALPFLFPYLLTYGDLYYSSRKKKQYGITYCFINNFTMMVVVNYDTIVVQHLGGCYYEGKHYEQSRSSCISR